MTRWNSEVPTEYAEQCKLAEYLDRKGYCWCHVPNGGNRDAVTGAKLKKQGVKPGVPDVLIFEVPEEYWKDGMNISLGGLRAHGIAIELKRQKGGRLRDSQKKWLDKLQSQGWLTLVAHGADEAIDWLEKLLKI